MTQRLNEQEAAVVWEHFPEISDEAMKYATNMALSHSRYIFLEKLSDIEKKHFGVDARAYCTSCNSSFLLKEPLKKVKQNAQTECPRCLHEATYKKAWIGYKNLQDHAVFIWFDKSPVDDQMITARMIFCSRKYSEGYKDVETRCQDTALYTFKVGESAMYNTWNGKLEKRKSIYTNQTSLDIYFALESLKAAVRGTPFEFSGWEKYGYREQLKYLALFAKYPNVEVLTKNDFASLVSMYMHGKSMHSAINWKARKLHEFFKLPKDEFKRIQESDATGRYVMNAPEFAFGLWVWQLARKEKSTLTYKELMTACSTFNLEDHKDRFNQIRKYSTLHRFVNYVKKQYEQHSKQYITPGQVIISWSDYLVECRKLEYDLNDEFILYPKNLHAAHQRTSQLIQIKEDEVANKKIEKRYDQLKDLILRADGFEIRPPATFREIINEGKRLEHCVGGYAKRHSEGQCTLMFIRQVEKPDAPFYTVELNVKNKTVVQVRGHKNKPATKEVQQFIDKFKELLQQTHNKNEKVRKQA